jgi:hypothetical protein
MPKSALIKRWNISASSERWPMRLKTGNSAVGQIADLGPQITEPRLHTVAVTVLAA